MASMSLYEATREVVRAWQSEHGAEVSTTLRDALDELTIFFDKGHPPWTVVLPFPKGSSA